MVGVVVFSRGLCVRLKMKIELVVIYMNGVERAV